MRLWAVVKLGLPTDICEAMLRRCAESLLSEVAATSNVEEMQWCPQSFANVAWSAAKLSECGSLKGYAMAAVVCAAVAKQAQLCLESFKPHELSMMAWACATMHGRKKSGNNARPDGAAALTWAAEEFNVKKPAPLDFASLMVPVAVLARQRLDALSAQSRSNIAWSLATVGVLSHAAAEDLWYLSHTTAPFI